MKKFSWIAALIVALTFVFTGCPDGGKRDPKPPVDSGHEWGEEVGMKPSAISGSAEWSDDNGGTIKITATSNSLFGWTWAELTTAAGVSISRDGGNLIVTYEIDVIKPTAALTIKNPAAQSDNPGTPGGWGQGKGAEYVLGDKVLSNYTKGGDKIVGGFYNEENGRGWFEINPLVYTNSTGIGFQHNFWCDMGSSSTIAENSVYTLKIFRIAPLCCTTCDITTSKDCLTGRCTGNCYDPDTEEGDCCFPEDVAEPFVAVTDITGVTASGLVGTDIELGGAVAPANATNKTIVWTLATGNTLTTATVTPEGVLKAPSDGTAKVTATITDGTAVGTAYTKDFEVTIIGYLVAEPEMASSPGNTHSTWSGDAAAAEDGSWSYTTGGLRYTWADIADDDATFDIDDYDFVAVYYTASGVASTVLKQYGTADDYGAFSGGLQNGSGSIVFEIQNATGDGFTIQKYSGSDPMTLKIEKLVFYKGTRYNITLNPGDGTVTPTTMFLVAGTRIGNHLPTPVYGDEIFMGWKLGTTVLTAATVVDSSFNSATLTASWREKQTLTPINITFSGADELTAVGGTVTLSDNGYAFTQTAAWDDAWVKFTIELPEDTILADYDKLSFSIAVTGTDANYKQVAVLAGAPLPNSFSASPFGGTYDVTGDVQYGSGTQVKDMTIIKGKAAALEGEIELSIHIRLPAGQTTTVTNIVLAQNE